MIDNNTLKQIKQQLFSQPPKHGENYGENYGWYDAQNQQQENLYAVIDGAACRELRFKLYDWQPESCCLWSGKLEHQSIR